MGRPVSVRGYYAALDKGYFKGPRPGLEIKLGGPDIVPQQVVASDGADSVSRGAEGARVREAGADLVNIAQVFQRSGTLEVSFKEKNITKPEDWKGKKVGTWGFGNEPELFAAMRKAGIDPAKASDVTVVSQPFDMSLLLNGQVDAAQAMIYNEYAQVLEQKNPKTGQLYTPAELNVIDFNQVGTAMLQDHIFVRQSWLSKSGNEDIAAKFLQASFKGWVFCRDNQSQCVDIVLKAGTTLGKGHMTWQLNEINALIWPSPTASGCWTRRLGPDVNISTTYAVLKSKPADSAFRTDLAKKARTRLKATGEDIKGQLQEGHRAGDTRRELRRRRSASRAAGYVPAALSFSRSRLGGDGRRHKTTRGTLHGRPGHHRPRPRVVVRAGRHQAGRHHPRGGLLAPRGRAPDPRLLVGTDKRQPRPRASEGRSRDQEQAERACYVTPHSVREPRHARAPARRGPPGDLSKTISRPAAAGERARDQIARLFTKRTRSSRSGGPSTGNRRDR